MTSLWRHLTSYRSEILYTYALGIHLKLCQILRRYRDAFLSYCRKTKGEATLCPPPTGWKVKNALPENARAGPGLARMGRGRGAGSLFQLSLRSARPAKHRAVHASQKTNKHKQKTIAPGPTPWHSIYTFISLHFAICSYSDHQLPPTYDPSMFC